MAAPEKRTRYNELLGVPNSIRDPDLYQLLGIERASFDPAQVEERFRERMSTLQAIKSPKHKSFIEFLKGELRRARSVLTDERQRATYDQELLEDRREQLTRILDVVLADGVLGVAEEQRITTLAAEVGLTPQETEDVLVEELRARGARRDSSPGVITGVPAPRADAARSASPSDIARAIARSLPPPGTGRQRTPAPPLPPRRSTASPAPPEDDEEEEIVAELVEEGPGIVAELVAPPPPPAGAVRPGPPASGWGRAAAPRAAGVCSSCLTQVDEQDLRAGAAERLPDGRLHCPACFNKLVAGLICCACYNRISRADMKSGTLKVVGGRACHGPCAGG